MGGLNFYSVATLQSAPAMSSRFEAMANEIIRGEARVTGVKAPGLGELMMEQFSSPNAASPTVGGGAQPPTVTEAPPGYEKMITMRDMAEASGYSPQHLHNLVRKGVIGRPLLISRTVYSGGDGNASDPSRLLPVGGHVGIYPDDSFERIAKYVTEQRDARGAHNRNRNGETVRP